MCIRHVRAVVIFALFLLLSACEGPPVELTTVRPQQQIYSEADEDSGTGEVLELGARIQTYKALPWLEEGWKRIKRGGKTLYVRNQYLVPVPIPSRVVYVSVSSAVEVDRPGMGAKALQRYSLGTRLEVSTDLRGLPVEYAAVIGEGVVKGFLRRKDLSSERPGAGGAIREATDALKALQFQEATRRARQARSVDPSDSDALLLLAALLDVEKPYESLALRQQLPATPLRPMLPPQKAPRAGSKAFIATQEATLRKSGQDGSPSIQSLPLGSEVDVLGIHGDWARVRLLRAAAKERFLALGSMVELESRQALARASAGNARPKDGVVELDELEVSSKSKESVGFLKTASLDGLPMEVGALRHRVKSYQAQQSAELATLALEQLILLDSSPRTAEKLLDSAIEVKWYDVAVSAARQLAARTSPSGPPPVELSVNVIYGCRGPKKGAVLGTFRSPRSAIRPTRDALLEDLAVPRGGSPEHSCLTRVNAQKPCDCRIEGPGAGKGRSDAVAGPEKELEKIRSLYHGWLSQVNAVFPPSPAVRVELHNASVEAFQSTMPLYLYSFVGALGGDCDTARPYRNAIRMVRIEAPNLEPGERIVLWLDLPSYDNSGAGAVFAASHDEAMSSIARKALPDVGANSAEASAAQGRTGEFGHWEALSPLRDCLLRCCDSE